MHFSTKLVPLVALTLLIGKGLAQAEDMSPLQTLFKSYRDDTASYLKKNAGAGQNVGFYKKWIERFEGQISEKAKDDPGLVQIVSEIIALKYAVNDHDGAIKSAEYLIATYPKSSVANYEKVNLAIMMYYDNGTAASSPELLQAFSQAYLILDSQNDIYQKADFLQKYLLVLQRDGDIKTARTVSAYFVAARDAFVARNPDAGGALSSVEEWAYSNKLAIDSKSNAVTDARADVLCLIAMKSLVQGKAGYILDSADILFGSSSWDNYRSYVSSFVDGVGGVDKKQLLLGLAKSYQKENKYEFAAKYYSECLSGYDLSDQGINRMSGADIKFLKSFIPDAVLCLRNAGMQKEAEELAEKYLNNKMKEQ